ncbi:hypothetical protein K3495_g4796 [Podosphaera aphanis]|nr:hypothetical protein K3495_g4796 [Podosphaera aphanis]
MNKLLPLDDWSQGHAIKSRASKSSLRASRSSTDRSMTRIFLSRKRMQSLPHTKFDLSIMNNDHNLSPSSHGCEEKEASGIRGLIRKASVSIKSRRNHTQLPIKRPRSAWDRLRTATGLSWQSRFLMETSDLDAADENKDAEFQIPGNSTQPPMIPQGVSGSAARAAAAAAAESKITPLTTQNNDVGRSRQLFSASEQQGDRESGIGIAVPTTVSKCFEDHDSQSVCTDISRIDFISYLPVELAIQVLVNLDQKTLRCIASVSKKWLQISQTQCVWRDVFLREQTKTYAAGKPIALGAGLGLPPMRSDNDWKDLYRVREHLKENWIRGTAEAVYLNGHLDSIYCLQFDEKKIITGSRDKTIRVWDLSTYNCTLIIGPPDVVDSPSIMTSANGRPQHYITMPDMTTKLSKRHPTTVSFPIYHNQSILCLQYDSNILATGSSDSTCIVYDVKNGYRPIWRLRHHTAAVLDLSFDDRHIVTCSKDVTICIWDRESGALIKQLRGHGGPVNAVQLRGNTIVSCSGDVRVKLWSIDTGKNIKELAGHTKGLACSQFSEDSRFIASAGNDKIIRIWDANSGETLKTIAAHDDLVRSLHIDSLSGRLVSGSYDQDIKVFDMASGALLLDFPQWHSSWVLGAKSDYRRMISTGYDSKILVMDFGAGIKGIEKLES